jgi:endogenous inhibitor of DNA gyrase (YacG/DUF329 family)
MPDRSAPHRPHAGPPCPICGRPVAAPGSSFPFCGEHCRLADLGNWLDERYVVPASEEEDGDGATRGASADDES